MSNLADLLPAGGGQNNTDFVADGNISAGAPVILTSDGKAAPISGSSSTVGAVSAAASSQPDYLDMASSATYLVAIYKRSSAIYARAGTVSGSTITWGTELSIYGGAYWSGYPAICYDSTNDKFIISWTERDATYTSLKCSPLTVNAGPPVTLTNGTISLVTQSAGTSAFFYNNMAYSPDTDHFVMVNAFGLNNYYGVAYVGQYDGSGGVGVNGTGQTFNSVNSTDYTRVGYDESADRFVITYLDSPGGYSGIRTGLAAGSSTSSTMTFGTEVTLASAGHGYGVAVTPVYDSSASKTVLVYKSQSTNQGEAVVATVGSTTITLASTAYVWQGSSDAPTTEMTDASFDSNLNQVVISWRQTASPYYSYFLGASISGEVITYGASTVAISANTQQRALAFNSGSNLTGIFAINATAGDGSAVMVAPTSTNLTSTNLLGLAPEAISDTATGTINTWGSRCESSSLLGSGPSAGADAIYAPTPDDPYRYSMCYDTANDKVVIAYNDEANNYYLYACVGTVTGNAISWGTVVAVDETATMDQIQLTYDTNADRVLLVFRDQGTGGDLSGRVGTVSGTTISFGSKTTGTPHPSSLTSVYDPTEQKHLLTYRDNNNSNYGYSCVATVTGGATNTVAFGTQVQFSSDSNLAGDRFPMCYYTSENKIVMLYDIYFTGKYAVACTISGTSVSFGTPALSYAWATYGQLATTDITYDSTATKAVEIAAKSASPHILYASVISLSGATVTWASPVIASATSAGDSFRHAASIEYSSAGNNFLIAFSDDSNSSYLYAVSGTLSGTSTTWGTPVVVRSVSVASDQETDLIYDPDSQNFVVAYRTATPAGESNVISVGDLPLTVTSDYYVQTDGTLSTDTGGQLIGNAIKTNQINIKDYTG